MEVRLKTERIKGAIKIVGVAFDNSPPKEGEVGQVLTEGYAQKPEQVPQRVKEMLTDVVF